MRRIAIATTMFSVAVVAAVYATAPKGPSPASFSHLAGDYDVRILRDAYGVPHVFGKTDPDAAFGLAYAHAEDDFKTIREALLTARGLLASDRGAEQAPIDYLVQLLRVWDHIEAGYSGLAPETRSLCEAYADGLNFYVSKHPGVIPARYLPFTGRDVVAGFVFKGPFFFGLDNEVMALFGDERAKEVSRKGEANPGLAARAWLNKRDMIPGSNAFAVGPSRTADGGVYLNINSHQPWDGPVAWYEAHVHSEEGWNAVGGVFPGAPVILVGHNPDLGWAHTVNKPDLVDIYVLEMNPDNPNQYKFDGEWKDLEIREAPIEIKLFGPIRWTVKREALWSVHGAVVRQPHGVYAIRYAGMQNVSQVEQWYRMNKARTHEEWLAAMNMRANAALNSVYADKAGNIHYIYNSLTPVRAEGYDWRQYLPGDVSETLWTEYIPFEAMPQSLNPPSGFLINCNNTPFTATTGEGNPDPAAVSKTAGIETHMTNRGLRAIELFGADDSITWEEFKAYKYDLTFSPESNAAKAWKHLCAQESDDPLLQEALAVLRKWDLSADAANTSAALALLTLQPDPDNKPRALDEAGTKKLLDDLRFAARTLKREHQLNGGLETPWGEVNRLHRGSVKVPLDGAGDVLRAVYSIFKRDGEFYGMEDGRLPGRGGDSYFLLVRWDADGTLHSESIHQYGSATQDRDSPHFSDQAELFARMETKPVWFDESEIRANLKAEYRPGEE